MENYDKQFVSFLEHYASCLERLKSYKVPQSKIQPIFQELDRFRKGFIDVSDLYEVDPQISEEQLFFIFKEIDCLRCGYITLEDFRKIFQSQKNTNELMHQTQNPFKNFMKILKATYYSIENKKKELHINENVLCKIFESAQRSSGKINMDANSLIHYFEMYTPEKISMIKAILQKVFNKENITLGLFVDSFKPTNEKQNQNYQNYQEHYPRQQTNNIEQYTANIDEILKKYQNRQSPSCSLSQNKPNFEIERQRYMREEERPPLYLNKLQQQYQPKEEFMNQRSQKIYCQAEKILDSQVLKNRSLDIQKRKQELRKGSLERKKIIQEILGNKYNAPLKIQPKQQEQKLYIDRRYHVDGVNTNLQKKVGKKFFQTGSDFVNQPRMPFNNENFVNIPRSSQSTFDKFYKQQLPMRPPSTGKLEEMFMKSPTNMNFNNTHDSSFSTSLYHSKSSLKNFYKRPNSENYQNTLIQKENILKRAEEEATKKIEEIQRKARLKVMEKKSAVNGYGKWFK